MLSINGLHNFYYLPELHDMRCKAQRICEIIRGRYHRDPLNGDVYMFMSKDRRKVRMIHYERNAYYLHEKSFIKGYKFMKIERKDDVTVYKIDWKDLVTILETMVEVNARDIQAVEKAVKEEIAKDEVSVIITKTPCVLLDKSKKPLYQTHTDKCKKCGMCMKPGCPAMTKNADGTVSIDDTMCTGCGLCASLCKFDAIELVKEGDR